MNEFRNEWNNFFFGVAIDIIRFPPNKTVTIYVQKKKKKIEKCKQI